ncbi:hypothetical protein PH210_17455 [Paenibacillus sp. BSR1-1]|uniref:hypothetical protein n=1 Tax=Paenibacillus sp. BSR1-1 TaxID=3020845 RepID=UPI0025AECE2F|nr:hypothetical protein [Paenibacillus sp. BSR1-1]MDN3017985.1 hypothetical protein [Paenibacillus sp. BSR1-1]
MFFRHVKHVLNIVDYDLNMTPLPVSTFYASIIVMDQLTLGWGFLTTAICMVIYLVYVAFTDRTKYE